ncbi:MAG TPA: TIGR01777 family oxidoreductase [Gemmatimonadaceae bacterium]|nr:TIGR01777 family oxidoreductase [Gemmatimonadaceae bacterium]
MLIAVTGSSGMIGSALVRALVADGHSIRRLVRRPTRARDEVAWNPGRDEIDAKALSGIDAVVNLAGENIAQRWTRESMRRIRESRVRGTTLVATAMASLTPRPRVLVSGSAVGYYGERGDEILDETSRAGDDFLASVCKDWEAATLPARDAGIRVAISRTGIVLDRRGGALAKMLTPFRLGVGGHLGNGRHWMSWIAISDMVRALRFLLEHDGAEGPFDLTAPTPVDNAEFTRVLASVLHRPAIFPVPRLALELLYGPMAKGAALASQRALPRQLLADGFEFALPDLREALESVVRPRPHPHPAAA